MTKFGIQNIYTFKLVNYDKNKKENIKKRAKKI